MPAPRYLKTTQAIAIAPLAHPPYLGEPLTDMDTQALEDIQGPEREPVEAAA